MRGTLALILCITMLAAKAQQLISKTPIFSINPGLTCSTITYLSDGLTIKGYLLEPKKPGKYPVIIFNRGGNGSFAMIDNETLEQWLAPISKEGYIIIASQYRGSPGSEGKDEMGGSDVNDVLNLLPVINKLPNADTHRIAMYGWSRGGIMTYRALARTGRIKTAIIGGAPTNLLKETARRSGMDTLCGKMIPGYWANRTKELQKRSAICWPGKINANTSLLIMHGTADWRVHYSEAQNLADTLKSLGRNCELRLFEGDDHILRDHRHEKDSIILAWLKSHL